MRATLENNEAFHLRQWSSWWGTVQQTLTGNRTLDYEGPNVFFFAPGGANRIVSLPTYQNGRYFIIFNSGPTNDISVQSALGVTLATLVPSDGMLFVSGKAEWGSLMRPFVGSGDPEILDATQRVITAAGVVVVTTTDRLIILNKAAPSVTPITLPAVGTRAGKPVTIIDLAGNGGDVTITPSGAETIMGAPNATLTSFGAGVGGAARVTLHPITSLGTWVAL